MTKHCGRLSLLRRGGSCATASATYNEYSMICNCVSHFFEYAEKKGAREGGPAGASSARKKHA